MLGKVACFVVAVASLTAVSAASQAGTVSPIFAGAVVVPTTTPQNKAIVGKGYYADMYGSWGIDYADFASYYGYYGNYNDAASYAYQAYQSFNAAAYYQATGG